MIRRKHEWSDYIDGVASGDIVAGRLVRLAVKRHLQDIESGHERGLTFNVDAANWHCDFFPNILRHYIGEWEGQPFVLEPWQQFIIGSIFGWRRSNGTRRFRKAWISLGRKNGKTALAAGIGLTLLVADMEASARIYCAATKEDQARLLFNDAVRMVDSSPSLKKNKFCTIFKNAITVDSTNSFFKPLGSDSKGTDGLNPTVVIKDEIHAWREQHRPLHEKLSTGGASRRQPLELVITTAGDDTSRIWQEEYGYCQQVLEGVTRGEALADSLFAFIAEIDGERACESCGGSGCEWCDKGVIAADDPFDESCWAKANPNLGVSVKAEYLREQADEARLKPTARNSFIRYHCNRKVTSTEKAIHAETWAAARGQLSDWKTADVVTGGLDLGGRDDLAGYAMVARWPVGQEQDGTRVYRYELRTSAYLADDSKRNVEIEPWRTWLRSGAIKQTPNVIAALRDDLRADADRFNCQAWAYDQFNARQLGDELQTFGLKPVQMPQSHGHFNEPIREFLKALRDGRILHNGDEVLAWCAGNLCIKRNHRDEWMCDKQSSEDKIDVIVAAIMAFREAMFTPARASGNLFIV